ncbi:hypothetical protein SynMEDNS5_00199 [Synechococcus sp. MEDNS5]|uniref:sulfotransferase family 2 domain-containing protein n=1 Tax=Synechococcus sp. MEDNS5 TaxID=1442554 RepID=UPI0016489AB0|nr:sulfotransferase family 2 domain-containing protein [Synechococcus sp. MEDNS5]QNJ04960.1 hypothetical protein SynMEDNS5_00199 [Synechococcus sp. MEDNS5]
MYPMKNNLTIEERKPKIHFLHIPKTGGTSLKKRFSAYDDDNSKYDLVFHRHKTRIADVPSSEKIVFFVRHPISRYYSSFLSRYNRGKPSYSCDWTPEEQKYFRIFRSPESLAEALSSLNIVKKYLAFKAMKNIRHVNRPLSYWIGSISEMSDNFEKLFHVGYQETYEASYNMLLQKLGLSEIPSNTKVEHSRKIEHYEVSRRAQKNLSKYYAEDISIYWKLAQRFES